MALAKYFCWTFGVLLAMIFYQAMNISPDPITLITTAASVQKEPFNRSPNPLSLITSQTINNNKDKVILITGSNSGIGLQTAKILSLLTDTTIIMASRSMKRGENARDAVIKYNNNTNNKIFVMELDLASFDSINSFINSFKLKYNSLDILICNAAISPQRDGLKTKDGLEAAFGVNHIGHMFLVLQLQDLMQKSSKNDVSRVIMVSAVPYEAQRYNDIFDINDLNKHNKWDAYMESKLLNIMFTKEFAKRHPVSENKILITSCHPGVGKTDLFKIRDELTEDIQEPPWLLMQIMSFIFDNLGDTIEQLAYTQLWLALGDSDKINHGGHYRNNEEQIVSGGVADNAQITAQAYDTSLGIIENIQKTLK